MLRRVGYNNPFVLEAYGENFKKQRKFVAADFSPSAVPRYYPLQETEARKLVRDVIVDPNSLLTQTKLLVQALI